MKQRKNKNRKQNFDNYIITTTEYEQEYPVDVFPIKKQNDRPRPIKARTISEAVKKYKKLQSRSWVSGESGEFNLNTNTNSATAYLSGKSGRWTDEDWNKHIELHKIHVDLVQLFQADYNLVAKPSYYVEEIKIVKINKVENQVMKSNYIKSNSKLAKWIHKRFVKYADQLGVSVPTYYINRRDIIERMGQYAVAKTSDCTCIGRCWYGSEIIWIDVNYHDKRWGNDQKEFRKNLDNTIANDMVHIRFNRESDPQHVKHDGSKQRREFDRRVNQVVRGKRYD